MPLLVITRPPQFLDPWFNEIEQVWDELEFAINNLDTRVTALESQIVSGVVTSISKFGDTQLTGDVTLTGSGSIVLSQVGNNINISGGGVTDHGALTGLLDDDHTQYLLASGARSLTGNWSVSNFQLLNIRVENVALDPVAGNQGRLIFNTTSLQLKVDNGSSFISAGTTDHGSLSGLLDDDHTQYLLVDGTRACSGDFTVFGSYKNLTSSSFVIESQEGDGASAIGTIIDTAATLSIAGAKLLSIQNNGVEKFSVDKDGNVTIQGNLDLQTVTSLISNTGMSFQIDADNNGSHVFSWLNGALIAVMMLDESGNLNAIGNVKVGAVGSATEALDVAGNMTITGTIQSFSNLVFRVDSDNDEVASFIWQDGLSATVMSLNESGDLSITGGFSFQGDLLIPSGGRIKSNSDLLFQIDADNDESAFFVWRNGIDVTVMSLSETGDLLISGTLTGGSSPFIIKSAESDGATARAFEFDTQNNLSTAGAKLLSLKNSSIEKFHLAKNGGIGLGSSGAAISVNSNGETIIGVTDTSSPRTVTLDQDDEVGGRVVIVKDESGAAGTNNITVDTEGSSTIDGTASVTITANYGVLRIYFRNGNWFSF